MVCLTHEGRRASPEGNRHSVDAEKAIYKGQHLLMIFKSQKIRNSNFLSSREAFLQHPLSCREPTACSSKSKTRTPTNTAASQPRLRPSRCNTARERRERTELREEGRRETPTEARADTWSRKEPSGNLAQEPRCHPRRPDTDRRGPGNRLAGHKDITGGR